MQLGLCRTWSETAKTVFLTTRLISDQLVEELAQKVDDLERRIERIGSTGATRDQAASSVDPSAAHGSCPNASPIHMHFHGANDEHDHDHGHGDTPDTHDTHVHIDLGLDLDAFHDFHRFKQRMHKHIDPEGIRLYILVSSGETLLQVFYTNIKYQDVDKTAQVVHIVIKVYFQK